jgi:N utilization substance protein A
VMNPSEVLRIVDAIHREKNIDKEVLFQAMEAALVSAAKRHYGEEVDIVIQIHREDGSIFGTHNGVPLAPQEISERIAAQTAKQVMIQKIREAERDALYDEYMEQKDQLVTGIVQRYEGGAATVTLPNAEAILPKSEQIPGETHHANERVRATVCEVRKQGSRVKIVLSRTRPHLVERLFEQEIPEIGDGVIEVKAMAREPGYRTKIAVTSTDPRVDCVGACVGVRGNRIKNIVDELGGMERIDIVRWSEDMQALIPNSLQPAEVDEVILCPMLGRAIVLVREDQLSLAIGRRGQNVRLASKLCGWDIEIMTREELEEQLNQAVEGFSALEGLSGELAERLVGEGFLSYDDLSVIEPDDLMRMGNLTQEEADRIIAQAEQRAEEAEKAAAAERRRQREQSQVEEAHVEQGQVEEARVEPGQVEGAPVEQGQVEEARVEPGQVEGAPVEQGQVEEARVEPGQVEGAPVEQGQVEEGQAEPGQVEEGRPQEPVGAVGEQPQERPPADSEGNHQTGEPEGQLPAAPSPSLPERAAPDSLPEGAAAEEKKVEGSV